MKKKLKNPIFTFVLGALIFSCMGVVAYSLKAKDITFTSSNTSWKVGNVSEALDSLMLSKTSSNYSTSEKKIGTWVDGKPIYQKTIIDQSSQKEKVVNLNVQNVDKYLNVDVRIIRSGSSTVNSNVGGYYVDNGDYFNWYFETPSTSLLHIRGGENWPKRPYDFAIILEYTKTTDSAAS